MGAMVVSYIFSAVPRSAVWVRPPDTSGFLVLSSTTNDLTDNLVLWLQESDDDYQELRRCQRQGITLAIYYRDHRQPPGLQTRTFYGRIVSVVGEKLHLKGQIARGWLFPNHSSTRALLYRLHYAINGIKGITWKYFRLYYLFEMEFKQQRALEIP
jgi:hypothetical protein